MREPYVITRNLSGTSLRIEASHRHWFKRSTYALVIDEEAQTLSFIWPDSKATYSMAQLGSVWPTGNTGGYNPGSTEDIIRGRALGGELGAFSAALGTSKAPSDLGIVVCRNKEGQRVIGAHASIYPDSQKRTFPVPPTREMLKFTSEAALLGHEAVVRWHEDHEKA